MSKGTEKERRRIADGTLSVANWQRQPNVMLQLQLLVPGCQHLDQLVVDVSNAWRSKVGKAVTDALLKFGPRIAQRAREGLPLLKDDELEAFVSIAGTSLWQRTKHLVPLLKAIRVSNLLLAFDERKEMLPVLGKGRVENTFEDVAVSKNDTGKLLNLLEKWYDMMRGWSASGKSQPHDQEKAIRNLVASCLHQSEAGRELARLLVAGVAEKIRSEIPELAVDLCEAREADIAVLNSRETFKDGKTVLRPPGWRVAIYTNDLDVTTEIRARPESEVFLNFVKISPSQLFVRKPSASNRCILELKARRFVEEIGVDELMIGPDQTQLSWSQSFNLLLTHCLGSVDYAINANETKGLVGPDGKTIRAEVMWQGMRAFRGVLKNEAGRKNGDVDVSFDRFVRFLRNPGVAIDLLDSSIDEMGMTARVQLAGALELRRNQLHILYGMVSRVMINFPLLVNRRVVVEGVKKFFPVTFLEAEDTRKILREGETRELPMRPIVAGTSACAKGFVSILIPAQNIVAKESSTKRVKVNQETAVKLVFRKVEMGGTLGRSSEEEVAVKRFRKHADVSLQSIAFDQLSYLGLEGIVHWLEKRSGPLPELQTSLTGPQVEGAKRMLIVGVAGSCLSAKSLLASDCSFADSARLFVAELRARVGAVCVISDAMIEADEHHVKDCWICNAGVHGKKEVADFVMQHQRKLIAQYTPDVVVAFGREASNMYLGFTENVFSVPLPEVATTVQTAAQQELFWCGFYSAFRQAAATLGISGGDDELRLYRQYCTLRSHFKIARLEAEMKVAERKTLTATGGTAGLTTRSKKKNKKQKGPVDVESIDSAGFVKVTATRTGVPFTAIEHSDFARQVTVGEDAGAPRALADLLRERLRKCVNAFNQMRLIMMLVDQLRAVAAAGENGVTLFDNEAYKEIFRLFHEQDVVAAGARFRHLMHLPGAESVFVVLREFFQREVMSFISEANLVSCMSTFFMAPLAENNVTRLDVVARQQTLVLLNTLLLVLSKGAVHSAPCAIWFAFSDESDRVKMKKSLTTAEEDVELDVWETVADRDGDDDWGSTKTTLSGTSLERKVRSVLQRLPTAAQEITFAAGATLRGLISELVNGSSLLSGAHKDDAPLDKWIRLLESGSFGVDSGLAPRTGEQVVREAKSTLGFVRGGLARALFGRMEQWPGCRLASLPSKCMPFHLPKKRFSDTPSFRAYLLSRSPSLPWYQPPEDVSKMSLASVFGIEEASSIIYAGGETFSFLIKDHKKRTATAVLKQQGECGVAISDLFAMSQDRDEKRVEAEAAVKARIAKGKAPAENAQGKAHRVPVGRTVGLVAENRLCNVDLPAQEANDVEYAVLKARAGAEMAVTSEMDREEKRAKKEAGEAAKKAAKLAGSKPQEAKLVAQMAAAAATIDKAALLTRIEEEKVRAETAVREEAAREAKARDTGAAAEAKNRKTLFHVKLQSNKASPEAAAKALLQWLLSHPLVVLDPGDRWVVSGIVAVLLSYDVTTQVEEETPQKDKTAQEDEAAPMVKTTLVKLEFAFRVVRVSGYKWNHFHFKLPESEEVPAAAAQQAAAVDQMESLLKRFTDPEFLQATPAEQAQKVTEVLGGEGAQARLKATMGDVMQREQILRDEARKKHQRYRSLEFVRRIDDICRQSGAGGDPIVVVGAGGCGTGRRGRQQAKHEVLLKMLAGFFTVFLLDEHCTSKKTTCCHRDCNAPRSKGRSRGCKNKECEERLGKPPWWDRDTGAAW